MNANLKANTTSNEWPEEYGIDLNPALAMASVWELPVMKTFVQMTLVVAVLLFAAAEANALGNGQSTLLGMGWWEGLFDSYTAGAYDAGGATIVGF